jgi:hypothetical protein
MFNDLPRFGCLTGKGASGRTSLVCPAAVGLTGAGKVVWLVATDPAAKVGQVIATGIGIHVAPNAVMSGLMALEIDPEHAAAEYRGGIVGPMCEVVTGMARNGIKEQLARACTTKIAAFEEVAGLDARCRAMPDRGSALGPRRRHCRVRGRSRDSTEVAGAPSQGNQKPDRRADAARRPVWCRSPARACPPQTRNCLNS